MSDRPAGAGGGRGLPGFCLSLEGGSGRAGTGARVAEVHTAARGEQGADTCQEQARIISENLGRGDLAVNSISRNSASNWRSWAMSPEQNVHLQSSPAEPQATREAGFEVCLCEQLLILSRNKEVAEACSPREPGSCHGKKGGPRHQGTEEGPLSPLPHPTPQTHHLPFPTQSELTGCPCRGGGPGLQAAWRGRGFGALFQEVPQTLGNLSSV